MSKLQIFQIDDYEWWVGNATAEQVLECYMRAHNGKHYVDDPELPRPLDNWELDILTYCAEDGTTRSFREQLAIVAATGIREPCVFAVEM